jgi:hypothetical protein
MALTWLTQRRFDEYGPDPGMLPLLAGAQAGKRFFGVLWSLRTPLWIRVGSATIE